MNRNTLMNLFLALPRPLSSLTYNAGRRFLFKNRRAGCLEACFARVREQAVPGDYLEFGVYRGTSFIRAWQLRRQEGLRDMRLFAFDGFSGLPEGEGAVFEAGDFVCSEALFRKIIYKAGVDLEHTVIVNGFYDQSLTPDVKREHRLERAAIVHVDCDLYSSTVPVLDFVSDLLDVGSILIFDDWYHYDRQGNAEEHGEQKAFKEWPLKDCFDEFYDVAGRTKAFVMARPAGRA